MRQERGFRTCTTTLATVAGVRHAIARAPRAPSRCCLTRKASCIPGSTRTRAYAACAASPCARSRWTRPQGESDVRCQGRRCHMEFYRAGKWETPLTFAAKHRDFETRMSSRSGVSSPPSATWFSRGVGRSMAACWTRTSAWGMRVPRPRSCETGCVARNTSRATWAKRSARCSTTFGLAGTSSSLGPRVRWRVCTGFSGKTTRRCSPSTSCAMACRAPRCGETTWRGRSDVWGSASNPSTSATSGISAGNGTSTASCSRTARR